MKYVVKTVYVDYQIWDDIKKLGVSYSKLGELTGIDRSNFAHMRKGKYAIGQETYLKIRAVVDQLMAEIRSEEGDDV